MTLLKRLILNFLKKVRKEVTSAPLEPRLGPESRWSKQEPLSVDLNVCLDIVLQNKRWNAFLTVAEKGALPENYCGLGYMQPDYALAELEAKIRQDKDL